MYQLTYSNRYLSASCMKDWNDRYATPVSAAQNIMMSQYWMSRPSALF